MTKSSKTKRHKKMDRQHLQLVIPFTTQLHIRFLCCLCEVTAGVSFPANAIDSPSR